MQIIILNVLKLSHLFNKDLKTLDHILSVLSCNKNMLKDNSINNI